MKRLHLIIILILSLFILVTLEAGRFYLISPLGENQEMGNTAHISYTLDKILPFARVLLGVIIASVVYRLFNQINLFKKNTSFNSYCCLWFGLLYS